MATLLSCPDAACTRMFIDQAALTDHAEAVHTFDDVRTLVKDALESKFGSSDPNTPRCYCWIQDIADDWVVANVSTNGDSCLQKLSYSIVDDVVTLGEPVKVARRTVYDPLPQDTNTN